MKKKLTTEQELIRIGYLLAGMGLIVYGGFGMYKGYFKLTPEAGSYLIISGQPAIYFGIASIVVGVFLISVILKYWHTPPKKNDQKG